MTGTFPAALGGASILALAITTCAIAQPAPRAPVAKQDKDEQEIIITGTQIRGATPAGAQVIGVTAEQAEAQGATSGNEVLAQVPQVANMFQNLPAIGGNSNVFSDRLPIARPALRNLPNVNTTGSLTLILVDGHRLVPVGTNLSGVDADAVPSSLLERAEIMPDGGSAIYGSDAVAGVINFITKDKYDGLELQGRYGLADKYWQYDASATAGTNWGSGGIFANISFSKHDALFGGDRDYIRQVEWNPLSPVYLQGTSTNCANPNIAFTQTVPNPLAGQPGEPATLSVTRLYPLSAPGGTIQSYTSNGFNGYLGGGNRCDSSDNDSFYPKLQRISVTAGFRQEITDRLTFDVKGTWQRRENRTFGGPFTEFTQNVMVLPSNPNYRSVSQAAAGNFLPADANATQVLRINYEPILGNSKGFTSVEWWQVTPRLTWDVSHDWQVRALGSYGESESHGDRLVLNSVLAQQRVTSGLINPYNLPASGAGAFDGLVNTSRRLGKFQFLDLRVVADGPLFPIWGSDVRAALGAEYTKTDFEQKITGPTFQFGQPLDYTQSVKSLFGELQIPLIGEENNIPLFHSLLLSASARYDKYNDFGDTFNPMLGVTWKPVRWITLRGNWNTSFTAPSPTDELGIFGVSLNNVNTNANAGLPYFGGQAVGAGIFGINTNPQAVALVLNMGAVQDLGPQKTHNWSLGFDIEPPIVPGLTLSASLYNISIDGLIASPFQPGPQSLFDFNPQLIYCANNQPATVANCQVPFTLAELQQRGFVTSVDQGGIVTPGSLVSTGSQVSWNTMAANYCAPGVAVCPPNSYRVFFILDNRSRNLARTFARGLDFSARYRHAFGWGSIDASFTGTRQLKMKQDSGPGTPVNDFLACQTQKWRWAANAGTTSGGFRGQLTWQHSAGFDMCAVNIGNPGTQYRNGSGAFGQTHIGAFDTFDLFLRYDFDRRGGVWKGLSLTLNVNNIFNTDPPLQKGGGSGNGPGFPLAAGGGGGGGAFTLGRMIQIGLTKKFGGS